MKTFSYIIAALLCIVGAIVIGGSCYIVNMGEQVVITAFGKQVGEPVTEPGLHFKVPFIQEVNRFEKRIMEWDGAANEMATKDKVYIEVSTFARWRIVDLNKFFVRIRDERSAESRLRDILTSSTMNVIGKHEIIELIRTTPSRKISVDARIAPSGEQSAATPASSGEFAPIKVGRVGVEKLILESAKPSVAEFGIELIDIRFKRLNYDDAVLRKIYDRMISERRQIADRFRSEGAAMAARINGDRERDLQKIQSEAYKKVQSIRGQADAKATEIYSKAFNQSPEAAEFYGFQKAMETYETSLPAGTNLIFSTDAEIFRYLKSPGNAMPASPPAPAAPAPAPVVAPAAPAPAAAPAPPVEAP
jgi:membrane protease subunit HflC